MASDPTDSVPTVSPNADPVRTEILQELVNLASTNANAQLDGLTTRLADALHRAAAQCPDPAQAQLTVDAANLLKKNRYPFYYVASERLWATLQYEIQLVTQPSLSHDSSRGTLKPLPPDVEIDRKLHFIQVSRALESEHTERLTLLSQRLAALLGRDELAPVHNPFHPHVFLCALHDAWCEFHPDSEAHALLFPHLQAGLCIDLAPILHALNAALVRRGVQAPRKAAPAAPTSDNPKVRAQPANDALARKLRQLFPAIAATEQGDRPLDGSFPTLIREDALQEAAARNKLLDYLTGLQQGLAAQAPSAAPLLETTRQRAPADALTPADEYAFDLLGGIFDAVFRNADIPAEFGALIGSLQLPLLRAAVADKDFFFMAQHPARRALELLAQAGIGWTPEKAQADPHYLAIRRGVDRVRRQTGPQQAVFAELVSTLESFTDKERRAADRLLATPIAEALQREKRQQASRAARDDVALRVGTGEVVAFVETFLEDKWVAVLTLAYGVKDEKPRLVANAIQTMDDLVWSVKPKITMAERKELLAKLPSMVAMLNKWLDLIKWDGAERKRFFKELAACHASIVRAPLDLPPERQAALAIEAAKRATERRLQKRAAQPPQPEPDEFDAVVQTLQTDTWLEFAQHDGPARKVRLAWISPMRSLYVFATAERQEALSLSAEELAQAMREQRARIVAVAGLVGRVLAATLGIDSANAASINSQAAA
jgi:hypothetical protein